MSGLFRADEGPRPLSVNHKRATPPVGTKLPLLTELMIDHAIFRGPNRPLTTIEEGDEDEVEYFDIDLDMEEKALLSGAHRVPIIQRQATQRHSYRRRFLLQFLFCLALGFSLLYALLQLDWQRTPHDLVPTQGKFAATVAQNHLAGSNVTTAAVQGNNTTAGSHASGPSTPHSAHKHPFPEGDDVRHFLSELKKAAASLPTGPEYAALLTKPPSDPLARFDQLKSQIRTFATLLPAYEAMHMPPIKSKRVHQRWGAPTEMYASVRRDELGTKTQAYIGDRLTQYEKFRYLFLKLSQSLWGFLPKPVEDTVMDLKDRLESGGRGVVMTVALEEQVDRRAEMAKRLRREGCKMPIQIMVLENKVAEMLRRALRDEHDIVVKEVAERVSDEKWASKETLKSLALLLSTFREAVFLNTDVLPDKPGSLFEQEEYKKTGASFLSAQGPRLPDGNGSRVDDNVIVIDKWRHYVALLSSVLISDADWLKQSELLKELNIEPGKLRAETWRLAFEVAGQEKPNFSVGS